MKKKDRPKIGRPAKYKPEFCQKIIEFFSTEAYEDVEIPHYDERGKVKWNDIKRMPKKLPTLVEFAKYIDVGVRTVYDWIDEKHGSYQEEFSQTYTRVCKELQKNCLIQGGLMGSYNSKVFGMVAVNLTDMKNMRANELNINMHVLPPAIEGSVCVPLQIESKEVKALPDSTGNCDKAKSVESNKGDKSPANHGF